VEVAFDIRTAMAGMLCFSSLDTAAAHLDFHLYTTTPCAHFSIAWSVNRSRTAEEGICFSA
jgi:hypothetical protein